MKTELAIKIKGIFAKSFSKNFLGQIFLEKLSRTNLSRKTKKDYFQRLKDLRAFFYKQILEFYEN